MRREKREIWFAPQQDIKILLLSISLHLQARNPTGINAAAHSGSRRQQEQAHEFR